MSDKPTPPDLYTKSDKVQLETALNKMRSVVEAGFAQMDVRLAEMNERLVTKVNHASLIASIAMTTGLIALLLAGALAVFR
jgi:hypothetical protein